MRPLANKPACKYFRLSSELEAAVKMQELLNKTKVNEDEAKDVAESIQQVAPRPKRKSSAMFIQASTEEKVEIIAAEMPVHDLVAEEEEDLHALHLELEVLGLTALIRRAKDAGVDAKEVDDAADGDRPKPSIIELIIAKEAPSSHSAAAMQVLRAELEALGLAPLIRRAQNAGVAEKELDNAADGDTPKASIIELLLDKESRATGTGTG